jgi:hypothetical protein
MGLLFSDGTQGLWVFIAMTVILGGAAAWATGRALAKTWRPYWQILLYMAPLAGAVRFLHYALFSEPLLSLQFYVVTYVVVMLAATTGYRRMRAEQMATQYSFAFTRAGPFGWRRKSASR